MIINDLDGYYIVFDTKNWNTELDTLINDITAIFAFLKYCLESKEDMSRVIAGMDWQELYSFASKQALL